MIVLRKSFYIHWSAGRSPRIHEVNPGRDPSSRSLMRIVFKPTLGQKIESSDSRVLALTFGVFSHIFLGFPKV